jgi:hypothetical protein
MVYIGYVHFAYNFKNVISVSFPASRQALGPIQLPIHWTTGALSPGVKWPEREADHSSPSSAVVKNGVTAPTLPNTP